MARRTSRGSVPLFQRLSRVYLATNRANVLPILSSGLIRPRGAYEKYYDDMLRHCRGRVPLWVGGFPMSLVSLASPDPENLFPVLVEVDPEFLVGRAIFSLNSDLSTSDGEPGEADVMCQAVEGPIALAAVRALHFQREEHREDFSARDFDNLLAPPSLEVTPDAFKSGGPDLDQVVNALAGIPTAPDEPAWYRRLDSAMGAVAMLALLLPPATGWLDSLAAAVAFPGSGPQGRSDTPRCVSQIVGWVLGRKDEATQPNGVDDRLARAAVHFLGDASPREGWVEANVASGIASRACIGATADEAAEIDSWRDVVIGAARSERRVGSLDDSGSLVRRALMLLVLRPQPDRILRAAETPMLPGPGVTAIAGMLSGLFHGYSRLSRAIKSDACPPAVLSRLAVKWSLPEGRANRRSAPGVSFMQRGPLAATASVLVEGGTLVSRGVAPDDSMMRLYYQAKSAGYSLDFDPWTGGFTYEVPEESGKKHRVIFEPGRKTARGQPTIRLRAVCRSGDVRRGPSRADAIYLLERNHDPSMQCRFAIDPRSHNIEVLVDQLLETMDSPELVSHVDAVVRAAGDLDREWRDRSVFEAERLVDPSVDLPPPPVMREGT
jgi:hypothetical protein